MRTIAARATTALRDGFPVVVAVGVLAIIAGATGLPFLNPPLGASSFVAMRHSNHKPGSPRSVVLSHLFAVLCGFAARHSAGCAELGFVSGQTFATATLIGSTLAILLTGFCLDVFDCAHPPAYATTLVVALGIIASAKGALALLGGAVVLACFSSLWFRVFPK